MKLSKIKEGTYKGKYLWRSLILNDAEAKARCPDDFKLLNAKKAFPKKGKR
tara:strand:+ start:1139 stop:1291 length:153 start_codon:yes stop_codon:yes gene_type:complete